MKRKETMLWIPLYVDKWLYGSTREELQADEQAIWSDFLCLGAKDEGFIRANAGFAYSEARLAGILGRAEELIHRTIEKCLKTWSKDPDEKPKLTRMPDGTLYITNWAEYQFSDRYARMIMAGERRPPGSANPEQLFRKGEPIGKDKKGQDRTGHRRDVPADGDLEAKFEEFWKVYPQKGRCAKKESRVKFGAIVKRGELPKLINAFHNYCTFLAHKKNNEGFDQRPMYAKTFLRDRWRDFVGEPEKPKL